MLGFRIGSWIFNRKIKFHHYIFFTYLKCNTDVYVLILLTIDSLNVPLQILPSPSALLFKISKYNKSVHKFNFLSSVCPADDGLLAKSLTLLSINITN